MNFKKLVLGSMNICILCNNKNNVLKDLCKDELITGKIVNHMDVIFDCFNIHLNNTKHDITNSKICISCVHQLQNALSFRKVVLAAQEKIQRNIDMLISKSNQSKIFNTKSSANILTTARSSKGIDNKKINIKQSPIKEEKISNSIKTLKEPEIKIKLEQETFNDPNDIDSKEIKIEFIGTSDNSTPLHNTEDTNTAEDFFNNYSSDSSTTSEQMRIATRSTIVPIEGPPVPTLKKSCRTCPECQKTFESFIDLERHYYSHTKNYQCDFCGLPYGTEKGLLSHLKRHYGITFPCKLCPKIYIASTTLYSHIRLHHNKVKIYTCTECDETFTNAISKRKHRYYDHNITSDKLFQCSLCEKMYFSKPRLYRHTQAVHENVREFSCQECGKAFSGKTSLKGHMAAHLGIKDYVCPVCGKAFVRRSTLREHLKIHNNIRNFSCDFCGMTFVQKCSLKSHVKIHYKNSKKQIMSKI